MSRDACPSQSEVEKIFAFSYQFRQIWKYCSKVKLSKLHETLASWNKEKNYVTVKSNFT